MRWAIIVIQSQKEFPVSRKLAATCELQAYVPCHDVARKAARGRTVQRTMPLIPGYAFMGDRGEGFPWSDIIETDGVLGWLGADGKPILLVEDEIIRIRGIEAAQRAKGKAMPFIPSVKVGDRVVYPGSALTMDYVVRSVLGRHSRIEVQMLGSTREIVVSTARLQRVG